jgi:TatD DNase family protein
MLSDSHCHVDFEVFDKDRNQILQNCLNKNIHRIIVPSIKSSNWDKTVSLCSELNSELNSKFTIHNSKLLYPALGLHPYFLSDHCENDIALLKSYCDQGKVSIIGEIGLDYYLKNLDRGNQLFYFQEQLKIAKKYSLTVLIHARKSHHEIIQNIKKFSTIHYPIKGIIHAFNGSMEQAKEYIKLGFKLGFGGAFTYPRAKHLRILASQLPLESIVLETDAPDMMPFFSDKSIEQKRNSPENISLIFNELTKLRDEMPEVIEKQLEKNMDILGFSDF